MGGGGWGPVWGETYACEGVGKGVGGGGFEGGEVEEGEGVLEGGFGFRGGFGQAGETPGGEGLDAVEVLEAGLREMGEVPLFAGGSADGGVAWMGEGESGKIETYQYMPASSSVW